MEYGSPAASRQDKCRLAGARRLQYCCCLFPCEATMHGTGDSLSRRDWLAVMGAAGAGAVLPPGLSQAAPRSEEHTSELQSRLHLVCRLLLEKKKIKKTLQPTSLYDT